MAAFGFHGLQSDSDRITGFTAARVDKLRYTVDHYFKIIRQVCARRASAQHAPRYMASTPAAGAANYTGTGACRRLRTRYLAYVMCAIRL